MRFRLIWDNQYQIVLKKHDVAALYCEMHEIDFVYFVVMVFRAMFPAQRFPAWPGLRPAFPACDGVAEPLFSTHATHGTAGKHWTDPGSAV